MRVFTVNCTVTHPLMSTVDHFVDDGQMFRKPAEAWDWIQRDIDAQISLVAREIDRLRNAVQRAEKEAGDAVVRREEFLRRREDETLRLLLECHRQAKGGG